MAVEDDVDRHSFAAQADGDGGSEFLVILDDEHAHLIPSFKDAQVRVTRR